MAKRVSSADVGGTSPEARPAAPRRFRLPKRSRLHLQRDFRRVFGRRCRSADPLLTVYADRNELAYCRLGVVVSRRLGKAVVRNRIKRLIREAFRLLQHELPAGLDVIVIPGPIEAPSLAGYQKSLRGLLVRLNRRLSSAP